MDNIVGRIQYDLRNLIHSPSLKLPRTDFDPFPIPLEFNSVVYNLRVTSRNPSFESMRLRSERNPQSPLPTHKSHMIHT
jgi:hypothetical protein